MIAQISAAVAALSLLAVSWFLIGLLKQAKSTISRMEQTVGALEQQVGQLSEESVKLLQQFQGISDNVQAKLNAADALFQSVEQVGTAVQQVAGTVRQASVTVSDTIQEAERKVRTNRSRWTEALDWTSTGVRLWRNWQEGRKSHSEKSQA
ncbi:DUF948 domain-containing protein [Gorillibacterium timonense]|uniref:DUF948 domain-containing protein n=1 Tax=Gorillibacterium timonense TaxID=1689269 RepID=UPI00071C3296|nr:DUF948 domain-containing protein [Gorillibacterium timonense]